MVWLAVAALLANRPRGKEPFCFERLKHPGEGIPLRDRHEYSRELRGHIRK